MNKYFWCEDSGAGLVFWTSLFQVINPDIKVQSKHNNTELRKAVSMISDNDNQYFIAMDVAMDNPDVVRETRKLVQLAEKRNNIHLIKIHSFEFVLLSFEELESWIFAQNDELKEKRNNLLIWRTTFINAINNINDGEILNSLKEALKYNEKYNSEQIAAKLLFEITRNTGFETTKGNIGECFINDCCMLQTRQVDDICGLDATRLSRTEKLQSIYKNSILKSVLTEMEHEDDYNLQKQKTAL